MADTQKTIEFILAGNDQVTGVLNSVGGEMESFGGSVDAVFSPFADAAKAVLGLNAALGAGTAALIVAATARAGEFADQMSQINTLTKLDSTGLSQFSDDLLAAAQNLRGADIAELQTSMYNAVSLGISDYTEALKAAQQAEKLAVGGQAELNDSLEFLVGTMNAYGAGVEEAERYSDTFFKTVEYGKTTIPELAASMSDVSGIASAAKIPIEQIGASISALTAAGTPTSQAITQIRSAIEGIIKPTDAAQKAAQALGIDLSAAALESKGFSGVMAEIQQATGGSVTEMTKLFTSVEGVQAALVLGADKSGTFEKALAGMEQKAGATEAAFAEMAEGSGASMQQLVNNIDVALIKAGEKLEGLEGSFVGPITDIFKSLSDAIDNGSFDGLFDYIKADGEALKEYLGKLAEAIPGALAGVDYGELLNALDGLKGAFGDIFEGLDLTTPEGLGEAIQTVVDGAEALIRTGTGIVESWTPTIRTIADAVKWFIDLDASTQGLVGQFLGISQQAVVAGAALAGIGSAVSGLSGLFGGLKASAAFLAGPAGLLGIAAAGGAAAGTLLREYVPAVDDAAQGVIGWIDSLIDFSGTQGRANESIAEAEARLREEAEASKAMRGELTDLQKQIDQEWLLEIEAQSTIPVDVAEMQKALGDLEETAATPIELGLSTEEFKRELADGLVEFQQFPAEKTVTVGAETDRTELEYVSGIIDETLPDGTRSFTYYPELDEKAVNDAARKIEEKLPDDKILRIETDLQIAQIEAQSKEIQSYLEYKAEVDVAEIEAASAIITTLAEGASDAFRSTGEVISSVFSQLSGLGDSLEDTRTRWAIEDQLEKENELRERSLKIQEALTKAQIEYMNARTERMERGEAMISVNIDSKFDYALRLLAEQFIEEAQIMATEEGKEYLLRIG